MKRSKAWKFGSTLLIFFLLAAFSAGCWGRQELENQSLVTVLGVDNGAGKRLRLTARIAIPRAAAGGPGGSGSTGPLGGLPITAEGEDMLDAVDAIQQITGRDVTMAHLTVLVVGEAFARTDVGPVVDVFSRMLQFRPNTLIVTCREKAEDFVKQFTPGEETEPSVMIRKLIESTHTALGGTPFVTMQDFLSAYNTVDSDPWTPYMTLASAAAQDDSKEGSTGDMPGPEAKGEVDKPVSEAVGGDEDKGDGKTESPKVVRVLGSAVTPKSATINVWWEPWISTRPWPRTSLRGISATRSWKWRFQRATRKCPYGFDTPQLGERSVWKATPHLSLGSSA